jgi:hypothetical protein
MPRVRLFLPFYLTAKKDHEIMNGLYCHQITPESKLNKDLLYSILIMSCFYCVDVHLSVRCNKIDDLVEDQKRVLSQAETNATSAGDVVQSSPNEV